MQERVRVWFGIQEDPCSHCEVGGTEGKTEAGSPAEVRAGDWMDEDTAGPGQGLGEQ